MDSPIEAIKSRVDLSTYVQADLGQPDKHGYQKDWWRCPFHEERTPSFMVDSASGRWHCWGSCNCGGDLLDYVQKRHNCDVKGAIAVLGGETRFPKTTRAAHAPAPKAKPPVSMNTALSYHLNAPDETERYFGNRAINAVSIQKRLLGTQTDYRWCYAFRDHTRKEWFSGERHTIPWMSGQGVKCINRRRDDQFASKQIAERDPEILYEIRLDMAKGDKEAAAKISDKELMDACLGPKYSLEGNYFPVYNANRLWQLDDTGAVVLKDERPALTRLSYVIITEGEADSIAIEQLGFPSVAAKAMDNLTLADGKSLTGDSLKNYYRYMFSKVINPIILADNDDAGYQYARKMQNILGRGSLYQVPDPHKDANEHIVADAESFEGWLYKSAFIKPPFPAYHFLF